MGSYDGGFRLVRAVGSVAVILAVLALAACDEAAVQGETAAVATPEVKRPDLLESTAPLLKWQQAPPPADEVVGLEVKTLAEGSGDAIAYGQIGRFHIIGSLASGRTFQDTYKQGLEPVLLRLLPPSVPKGFAVAADGMKSGERRSADVAAPLGYGESGELRLQVPANARLFYEIELVEVVHDLEIRVMQEGDGAPLEFGQTGSFVYTGVRDDGVVFDSCTADDPRRFPLREGGLIQGWLLGLPGMKPGEKRWLKIPPALAYGETGNQNIAPGATLIFEVELLEIIR